VKQLAGRYGQAPWPHRMAQQEERKHMGFEKEARPNEREHA